MFFTWLKSLHRQKFLNEPFPQEWLEIIDANAVQYLELKATEQAKLRDDIRIVVAEKHWEGCDGLVITDEIKVTIAAQACLLLVGMKPGYYYDRVRSVIVYPEAFRRKVEAMDFWSTIS